MARISRKPAGWEHLFEIPGERWEQQTEDLKAMHVTLKGSRHVVVYAYAKSVELNVVTYTEGKYTPPMDNEQWLGPMEAMCLLLELIRERDHAEEIPTH